MQSVRTIAKKLNFGKSLPVRFSEMSWKWTRTNGTAVKNCSKTIAVCVWSFTTGSLRATSTFIKEYLRTKSGFICVHILTGKCKSLEHQKSILLWRLRDARRWWKDLASYLFDVSASVNTEIYLALLKNNLWLQFEAVSSRRQYYYQKDEAQYHG